MTFGATFGRLFEPTFNPKSNMEVEGGWWLSGEIDSSECVAAYQPKGAADYAASKVNLAHPGTSNAGDGTAYPTWDDSNGWKFLSSSSQYITTDIIPTKTWSVLIRLSNITSNQNAFAFGNLDANSLGWGIKPNYSSRTYYYNGITTRYVSRDTASGVFGLAGAQGYFDGYADGFATASGANPNAGIFIGDFSGSTRRYITAYAQAFAIYNITLTPDQMLAVTTAMNAL